MFWNYLKIALRNLRKKRMFSLINVLGLAIGLTIYLFTNLLVGYHKSFDSFFKNSERIFTVGSIPGPTLEVPFDRVSTTYSRVRSILKSELPDIEAVARIFPERILFDIDGESRYQQVVFSDPELLEVFDFAYVQGDVDALTDPSSLLITVSKAVELFGSTDVIGKTITLDNRLDLSVAAVIEDIPKNSHFSVRKHEIFASTTALSRLRDFDIQGNFREIILPYITYVLLPEHLDRTWLDEQLDQIYEQQLPEHTRGVVSGLVTFPIYKIGTQPAEVTGFSQKLVLSALALLILAVAVLNYTNLAIAQSMSRSREIGMRKALGALKGQLLGQFILESLVVAAIAMVTAIAALELLIPVFNRATDSSLRLSYLDALPLLAGTTLLVGLVAGIYPASLIARFNTIDALRDLARKGQKSVSFRSVMIGAQFAISTFLLSAVVVVHFQNKKVEEASLVFPKSEIYVIEELRVAGETVNLELLQREMEALPSVRSMAFSSQTPFMQLYPTRAILTEKGNAATAIKINQMAVSSGFFETYDIPLLAGRNLSDDMANDQVRNGESKAVNIMVSESAVAVLGFSAPEEVLNYRLYAEESDRRPMQEAIVVGVVADRNIIGFAATDLPWMFNTHPNPNFASVRFRRGAEAEIYEDLSTAWKKVAPTQPLQGRFLDETFNEVFEEYRTSNLVLAVLAFLAFGLAMVGLYGLTVFLAVQKTKEIGMRKVLGASSTQLAKLLVWQFSKPVLWALAVALPLAFVAAKLYSQFFSDPIENPIVHILAAGTIAVLLGWATVAGHAYSVARTNPITALRHE